MQDDITNIRYIFSLEPLVISEAVLQDQKPEGQQTILEAGQAATLHSEEYVEQIEAKIKEELAEKGMQIVGPANNALEWIEKATSAVWPQY